MKSKRRIGARFDVRFWLMMTGLLWGSATAFAESPEDSSVRYVEGIKKRCLDRSKAHFDDVKQGRYLAPTFQSLSKKDADSVSEQGFLDELRGANKKTYLVLARGGLGKSRLAQSLQAQLCNDGPVFMIDLAAEPFPQAKARWSPEGWLLERIAVHARLSQSTKERVRFFYKLRDRPFYLVIDALDEINQRQRAAVIHALNGLQRDFPDTLRLVMLLRPTLYTETAAVKGPKRVLRLNPLQCAVSKRFLNVFSGDAKGPWSTLLQELGLDEQRKGIKESCNYLHLATFRDVKMVAKWAKWTGFDSKMIRSFNPDYSANRHELYQTNAALVLGNAWPKLSLEKRRSKALMALDILHDMIGRVSMERDTRSVEIMLGECQNHAKSKGVQDAKSFCRLILGSKLFKFERKLGVWRFKNQSIADSFIAERFVRAMGSVEGNRCAFLRTGLRTIQTSEIGALLLGTKEGRACIDTIVDVYCSTGRYPEALTLLLQAGLGAGPHTVPRAKNIPASPDTQACKIRMMRDLQVERSAP